MAATQKVLIYATLHDALLVFDEPDFPEIALQIPGGTIEPGEEPSDAATREFEEETGLRVPAPPRPLTVHDYSFVRDGVTIVHRRHYFHVALMDAPTNWTHFEMSPSGGGDRILFRFSWMSFPEAAQRLGMGMADAISHLR
ncbi:NUDIX domain-containing protein [Rhizobium sp. DKSPLA3]|uniref:NUDIX domain-containing protein n=1 Tax=Rhizobium quercicola TaxID=2901226 RepID=A0A9X1T3A8_9HYPH|nr:NUDIX domain-containing protein [Rhizobium quercicola]MCD7111730.1 NUDIX domain-containing protein [Rhizobium quercicola]